MAKPVNRLTGDAPDGQNPNKKYVPTKEGSFKYTPPPPPKPDPRDANIFTEEKLQRSGGKMKEPPMGLDSKKKGGVIKKRFARGGEIMDEVGMDAEEASSKASGLKASKGEDVGFFKRLMMGNIDAPGSEAYNKFGAGRGRVENMPAPVREAIKRPSGDGFKPEPTKEADKPVAKPPSYADHGEDLPPEVNRSKYNSDYTTPNKVLANVAKPKITSSKKETKGSTRSLNLPNKKEEDETVASPVVSTMSERYKIPGDYKEVKRVNALRRRMGMAADDETEEELRKEEFGKKTGMYAKGGPIDKETVIYPRDTGKETVIYPKDTGKETVLEDNPDLMKRGRVRGVTGEIANLDSTAVRDRKTAQMLIAQDEKFRKKHPGGVKAYAQGGSVSSRGDGCAQRGKTRGKVL